MDDISEDIVIDILFPFSFFVVKTAKMQWSFCWTMGQMQIPNITLETTRKYLLINNYFSENLLKF